MDWLKVATRTIAGFIDRVPLERMLVRPRNTTKDREELKAILKEAPLLSNKETLPPQTERPAISVHKSPIQTPTTDETVEYQNREIGKILYQIKKHAVQGFLVAGKACDCMPGDSLVYLSNPVDGQVFDSVKPFSEVYKRGSNYVLSHNLIVRRVTAHMSRYFSGELNEMTVRYCNIPLKLTMEHPVLALKDGVRAKQLKCVKETDSAWVPSRYFTPNDFVSFPRQTQFRDMEIITPNLAELIGWYLAEGCHGKESRIVISLGYHEKAHINHVMSLFHDTFGEYPKVYERQTTFQMAYSHREFAAIFSAFGSDSLNKCLPQWCLRLPHYKVGPLLKGLFAGDGYLSKHGLVYSTSSLQLACQLRVLLFNLGILHSLSRYQYQDSVINDRSITASGPRYVIRIYGEAMERLVEITKLPWSLNRQRRVFNQGVVGEANIFLPARRIQRVPFEGTLYNMSVSDDESYLTPQGAVHNCGMKHLQLELEGDCEETMPMVADPSVYIRILNWIKEWGPKVTLEAVQSGAYTSEYPTMSHQARDFIKELMGTEEVSALFLGRRAHSELYPVKQNAELPPASEVEEAPAAAKPETEA